MSPLRGERGSMAIELAFLAPVLLLLLGLVYAYGRVAQVNGTLEAGTRDAARAASQARSIEEADDVARSTVVSALGPGATDCLKDLQTDVVGRFDAGVPVRVRSTCTFSLAGLGLPGVPGTIRVTKVFTSPVDPNRGIDPGVGINGDAPGAPQ